LTSNIQKQIYELAEKNFHLKKKLSKIKSEESKKSEFKSEFEKNDHLDQWIHIEVEEDTYFDLIGF